MGIILSEPTHAGHPAEFTALFVSIDSAELSQANREFSVAMFFSRKNLDMMRTVHGLQKVFLFFIRLDSWVLAFFVVREMA